MSATRDVTRTTPSLLRGNPNDLRQRPTTRSAEVPFTGTGYFGTLYLADDPKCYSIELLITIRQHTVPLLVPGLTRAEITHLVAGGMPTQSMIDIARIHAETRRHHHQSVFAQLDEPMRPLPEDEP